MFLKKIRTAIYIRLFRWCNKTKFKSYGNKVSILLPLKINGIENITIGNNVSIACKAWLAAMPLTGSKNCELVIRDGSSVGNFAHFYATKSIVLGKNVLVADKVYISDNLHVYEDITKPIMHQAIKQIGTVSIGDGSWIGENVCIIGAKIGKNCVVGANAVVTKDVPDYCVVVGSPAKIIKMYCFETQTWRKTFENGNFITLDKEN